MTQDKISVKVKLSLLTPGRHVWGEGWI